MTITAPRVLTFAFYVAALSVAPANSAFADTIDAAAKPYIVWGSFLAAVIFAALAIFLITLGRTSRRLGRASPQWPMAEAKILTATVAAKWHPTAGTYYVPRVHDAYTVAGQQHVGDMICPGVEQFGYGGKTEAQTHVARYPVGTNVPVHYNPENPTQAVLEATEIGGGRNIFAGAICAPLAIGALMLALWASALAEH